MSWRDPQVFYSRGVNWQRLPVQDCTMDGIFFRDVLIRGKQYFRGVGLAVCVNQ